MRRLYALTLAAPIVFAACAAPTPASGDRDAMAAGAQEGTLARIYYWRAKPGKYDEYTRYVTEHAEPIDGDAQAHGAFLSITTYTTRDTLSPWTHMRVFVLRDSAQLAGLSAALNAAGLRLEPDSVKRRETSQYGATLRDAVGSATVEILR